MKLRYHNSTNPKVYVAEFDEDQIKIGRGGANDIVLESRYVPDDALRLEKAGDGWELQCYGGRCSIGDASIEVGNRVQIPMGTEFSVFPYVFCCYDSVTGEDSSANQVEVRAGKVVNQLHLRYLETIRESLSSFEENLDEIFVLKVENDIEKLCDEQGIFEDESIVDFLAGNFVRGRMLREIFSNDAFQELIEGRGKCEWSNSQTKIPEYESRIIAIQARLWSLIGGDDADLSQKAHEIEQRFWSAWQQAGPGLMANLQRYLALQEVQKQLKDIMFGYGPLEDLLRTPSIDEIMVVGRDKIYVEKSGTIENSGREFIDDKILFSIIERIVSRVDRQIDKSQPLVDARLTDGSRVNAVIDPISLDGPLLTIRKFPEKRLTIDQLVHEKKAVSEEAVEFLKAIVTSRCNILVAGGTGTGKTTLLNCLSQFVGDKERIVTIEDTAELQLMKQHVCRMETKTANCEGVGSYRIRDLLINSLRMRPDRIIVGECRGPEALDMLQAMNTGHDGSMTTLHANNPADVVLRLEVMVLSAADLPVSSIRSQISSAIDFIVQLERTSSGRRVVSRVTEVCDVDRRTGEIRMKDIFAVDPESEQSGLTATGSLPSNLEHLLNAEYLSLDKFFPAA